MSIYVHEVSGEVVVLASLHGISYQRLRTLKDAEASNCTYCLQSADQPFGVMGYCVNCTNNATTTERYKLRQKASAQLNSPKLLNRGAICTPVSKAAVGY